MKKVLSIPHIERALKEAYPRKALDGRKERKEPLGVAGRIERALRPASVGTAVEGEDARVDIKRVVEPTDKRFVGAYARTL